MKLFLKFNLERACKIILQEKLGHFGGNYQIISTHCVVLPENLSSEEYQSLKNELNFYGIDIIENQKLILAQRIKEAIIEMLDKPYLPSIKISSYLSDKLNENYRTLSQAFTDIWHITIESFMILQKIEKAKLMLTSENISLTEISYRLNYSSVAHLSNQFKKLTGITPSDFLSIIQDKRNLRIN